MCVFWNSKWWWKKLFDILTYTTFIIFFIFFYVSNQFFFMLLRCAFCLKLTKNKNAFCWKIFIYIICFETNFARFTQYCVANYFIDFVQTSIFELILSANSITWKIRKFFSIINFLFMINFFRRVLLQCHTCSKINQSSNHISIFTLLTFEIMSRFKKKTKIWKQINTNKLLQTLIVFDTIN